MDPPTFQQTTTRVPEEKHPLRLFERGEPYHCSV
jgi:hypothetical protein